MHWIDIVLLIPILWGLYRGYSKGLFFQLAGFLGLVLGIFCAFYFSAEMQTWVGSWNLFGEDWLAIMSFVITFFGIIILLRIIAFLLTRFVKAIGLGFFERTLGAILGAFKWYLICLLFVFIFIKINDHVQWLAQSEIENSTLYPYFDWGIDSLQTFWKNQQ